MLENCHGRRKQPTVEISLAKQCVTAQPGGRSVRYATSSRTMSIATRLEPSKGFHPVSFSDITLDNAEGCNLSLQFDLSPEVFVDPHELALRSSAYTFEYDGSRDLEKPVNAVEKHRSTLSIYPFGLSSPNLTVEVPLHLRYGTPTPNGGHQPVSVPWPRALLRCASTPSVQLNPTSDSAFDTLYLPVGSQADLSNVQLGTAATILACFFYIIYMAQTTATRLFKHPVEKKE